MTRAMNNWAIQRVHHHCECQRAVQQQHAWRQGAGEGGPNAGEQRVKAQAQGQWTTQGQCAMGRRKVPPKRQPKRCHTLSESRGCKGAWGEAQQGGGEPTQETMWQKTAKKCCATQNVHHSAQLRRKTHSQHLRLCRRRFCQRPPIAATSTCTGRHKNCYRNAGTLKQWGIVKGKKRKTQISHDVQDVHEM